MTTDQTLLWLAGVTCGLALLAAVLSALAWRAASAGLQAPTAPALDQTATLAAVEAVAAELREVRGHLANATAAAPPEQVTLSPADEARLRAACAALAALVEQPGTVPEEPLEALVDRLENLVAAVAAHRATPTPMVAPERAEEPPERTAEDLALAILDRGPQDASSARFRQVLKAIVDVPIRVLEAIETGEAPAVLQRDAAELDLGLYERFEAAAVQAALPDLPATEAAALATWLRERQAQETARLADRGVQRVATSVGSPFEPGRVVPDPEEPPRPTDRRELDGRVAGVKPGRGGYELNGRLICPTRAIAYVWNESRSGQP